MMKDNCIILSVLFLEVSEACSWVQEYVDYLLSTLVIHIYYVATKVVSVMRARRGALETDRPALDALLMV